MSEENQPNQPSVSIDEALQLFFAVAYPQGPPEGVDPEQFFALLKNKIAQDRPEWAAAHGEAPPEEEGFVPPAPARTSAPPAQIPVQDTIVEATPVAEAPIAEPPPVSPSPVVEEAGPRTYPFFSEGQAADQDERGDGDRVTPAAEAAPVTQAETQSDSPATPPGPSSVHQTAGASTPAAAPGQPTVPGVPGVPVPEEPLPHEENVQSDYDRARAAIYAGAGQDEVPTDPEEKYFYDRRKKLEAKIADRKQEERDDQIREDIRRRLIARNNGRVDAAEIERAFQIRQQLETRLGMRAPVQERPTLEGEIGGKRAVLKTEDASAARTEEKKEFRPDLTPARETARVDFTETEKAAQNAPPGLEFLKNLGSLSDEEKIEGLRAFNESRRGLLKTREELVYRRLETRENDRRAALGLALESRGAARETLRTSMENAKESRSQVFDGDRSGAREKDGDGDVDFDLGFGESSRSSRERLSLE